MNFSQDLNKSFLLFKEGKFLESLDILNRILLKDPENYDALSNKAFIKIRLGEKIEAKNILAGLFIIRPEKVVGSNLIILLIELQLWEDAKKISDKLKIFYKDDTNILLNHALILRGLKKFDDALLVYDYLIKLYPTYLPAFISKGYTLNLLNRFDEAISILKLGLKLDSKNFQLLFNLSICLMNNNQYQEAIVFLKKALNIENNNIDVLLNLASALSSVGSLSESKKLLTKVNYLLKNNKNKKWYFEILLQNSKNDFLNGDFEKAKEKLKEILDHNPGHIEANYYYGIYLLKEGRYGDVHKYYAYRTLRDKSKGRYGKFNDIDLPKITNKTKLLVYSEQGIGDVLIIVRLLSFLRNKVESLVFICYDKLLSLLGNNFIDIDIISESEFLNLNNNAFNDHLKINLFSIFHYIDDIDQEIKNIKLLKCDEDLKKYYRNKYREKNKPLIGISWTSKVQKIGKLKSYQLSDIYQILNRTDEFSFINLQYGDVKDEIADFNKNKGTKIQFDYELDYYNDIYSLASLVAACDVIITCSNVTAHIAGSLGIKTFVMLPKKNAKLWYWYENENISSWYPSVNLINQTTYRDWNNPVKQIIKELENL